MAITQSDLKDAAARVSSSPRSVSRGPGGIQNYAAEWELQRERIGRALIADPDLVLYMSFLCSNRLSARVQKVTKILRELIPLVEGWKLPQSVPGSTIRLDRAYQRVSTRISVGEPELAALRTEADLYVSTELVPTISTRGRYQARGEEATAKYGEKKAELLAEWKKFKKGLIRCKNEPRFNATTTREFALRLPMENLGKTMDTGFSPEKATEYTVQLLAASAAVQALGREVSFRYRLRISLSETFPEGVSLQTTVDSSGFLATVTPSVPPKELGIRSGDIVTWGSSTAIVTSVGDTSFSVGSSKVLDRVGTFSVSHAAYPALKDLTVAVSARDAALPSVSQLQDELTLHEGGSAAHIRDLIVYLSGLYAQLDTLSSPILASLTRVGGSVQGIVESLLAVLNVYSPSFHRKTSQTGDKLLDSLERDGSDYAVELLLQGNFVGLLGLRSGDTSKLGRVSSAVTFLSSYTGGDVNGLG